MGKKKYRVKPNSTEAILVEGLKELEVMEEKAMAEKMGITSNTFTEEFGEKSQNNNKRKGEKKMDEHGNFVNSDGTPVAEQPKTEAPKVEPQVEQPKADPEPQAEEPKVEPAPQVTVNEQPNKTGWFKKNWKVLTIGIAVVGAALAGGFFLGRR